MNVIIRTSTKGTGYYVTTPYNVKALDAWRSIPGRKFDRSTGENFIPMAQKRALWNLLRTYYAGLTLVTNLTPNAACTVGPIPSSTPWGVADLLRETEAEWQACVAPKPVQPELTWGDAGEMKTPIVEQIAKEQGWDVVELPAVTEALSKRANRAPRSKRAAKRARP